MKKILDFIKNNIFIILAIIYFIWPFDFIAEVFVFAGGPLVLLDDAGFLGIAILQKIYSIWKDSKKIKNDGSTVSADRQASSPQAIAKEELTD